MEGERGRERGEREERGKERGKESKTASPGVQIMCSNATRQKLVFLP